MVVLDDSVTQSMLEGIRPDHAGLLAAADPAGVSGVIITCRGGKFGLLMHFNLPPNKPAVGIFGLRCILIFITTTLAP